MGRPRPLHPVCVIDDDDAVRDSLQLLLESHGYDVHEFASAERFLAHSAGAAPCTVLVVDQHMPGMTGLELLELLRARGHTTPALIITGRIDPEINIRAEKLGITVLQKPLGQGALMASIEAVADRPDLSA